MSMEKKQILLLLVINLTNTIVSVPICLRESANDYILRFQDQNNFVSVTEGDDRWLQMALDMIDKKKCDYVALLFGIPGIETQDETLVEKNRLVPSVGNQTQENCPFPWLRRSPENLLGQDNYLTLATLFVLLRILHFIFPTMVILVKFTWGHVAQNMRPGNLLEQTVAMYLNEPCRSSNLQEGAMNAKAWASKSLTTTVTSSRNVTASQ